MVLVGDQVFVSIYLCGLFPAGLSVYSQIRSMCMSMVEIINHISAQTRRSRLKRRERNNKGIKNRKNENNPSVLLPIYLPIPISILATSNLRRPPLLHTLLPLMAPDRSRPRAERSQHKEESGDGRKPPYADGFDDGQASCGAAGGEQVADHVVAGDDFGGLLLHDVLRDCQ